MPLSHQHNKVLYFSLTIAKALSVFPLFNLEGITLERSSPSPQGVRGVKSMKEKPFELKDIVIKGYSRTN